MNRLFRRILVWGLTAAVAVNAVPAGSTAEAILLSVSAVEIYREDSAYKTADPMENIYTLEKVTGKFAPIAPLFCAGLELMVATDRKINQRKGSIL